MYGYVPHIPNLAPLPEGVMRALVNAALPNVPWN